MAGRSQRHKIEEQGFASNGAFYDQGAVNDAVLKAIGGAVTGARPVLGSISPTTAAVGASQLTLTATGSVFTTGNTQIVFKGVAQPTTFVSATSLTCPILPVNFGAGAHPVQVVKGGSLVSADVKTFTITGTTRAADTEEAPEPEAYVPVPRKVRPRK